MKQHLYFIAVLFFVLQPMISSAQNESKFVTFDEVVSYSFYPQRVRGLNSLNNGEEYSSLTRDNKIEIFNYKSGKRVKTLAPKVKNRIHSYSFSPNDKLVLIATEIERIYRHSFTAEYYIYDIEKDKIIRLSENGKQQLATFSPDQKKIAFVRRNNLFYLDLNTREEIAVTLDGKPNQVINGAPDWVYEEEFGFSKAFEWSPDSKTIAYYRFDESKVKQFNMQIYDGLYPSVYRFKYPKAGEDNSIVSINLYDLVKKKSKKVDTGKNTDIYIPRIKWTSKPNQLAVARLNRLQNKMELLFSDLSGKTEVLYTEENKTYYDYSELDNLDFHASGETFSITSEKSGYRHLYLFNMKGKQIQQITKGEFDLTEYYGFDERKKKFYVQAAATHPTQREIYAVDIKGKSFKKLTPEKGVHSATFSKNFKFFINAFSSANKPHITKLYSAKGNVIRLLKENDKLESELKKYNYQPKEMFSFETSEGVQLNGFMIKPYNFDTKKKYPVFMYQYSGPNSQTVLDSYGGFTEWFQMLAQKGYIVVSVDGRGTGARGEKFRKVTYKNLGKFETIDQIEAAKYLQSLSYVDAKRIGIFGWSYGGYMSTSCILKGNDTFKAAIAVAPVTNWRYYDNIYTERYMRRPQENAKGYDENSPIHFVDRLKGAYLLIHGTGDDNVHVANSIELSKELIKAGKDFDCMLYPNENHGIRSSMKVQLHLFTKMTNFILEKL